VDVPVVTAGGDHVDGESTLPTETPAHTVISQRHPDVGESARTHSPRVTTFDTLCRCTDESTENAAGYPQTV
jgi:ribulose-5-phosphate 4-epimerase/fuculose-1-phosphate aldolase